MPTSATAPAPTPAAAPCAHTCTEHLPATTPPEQLRGFEKWIRKWGPWAVWLSAAVLLGVIIWTQGDVNGAIETAVAIFTFGVFVATIQTKTTFYVTSVPVIGALAGAFYNTFHVAQPGWATAFNAVATVVSVVVTTFGSNQRTHLN